MQGDARLRIYLADHFAATALAGDLAARSLRSNRGSDLEAWLRSFLDENDRQRSLMLDAMRRVGATRNPLKDLAARVAERLGRLKLNGQLRGYSPLSRLVEIETLLGTIAGCRSLWIALGAVRDPRWVALPFGDAARRLGDLSDELERIVGEAASEAFGGSSTGERRSDAP
jgi:hypothetical protein